MEEIKRVCKKVVRFVHRSLTLDKRPDLDYLKSMESNVSAPVRTASPLRSFSLVLLGMILGAGLVLVAFWHQSSGGGLAARMAGVWTGTAQVAGTQVSLSLTLQKTGDTFSGQLVASPGGEGTFQQATIDSQGNISFSMTVSGETVAFTGKATPDAHAMTGKVTTTSYGEGTWSLTKQS